MRRGARRCTVLEESSDAVVRLAGGIDAGQASASARFMGTLVLILLGNGVVANVLLRKSKSENAGWMVIAAGMGLRGDGGRIHVPWRAASEGHLNPAVTLAAAVIIGRFQQGRMVLCGADGGRDGGRVLVWLHYLPHWRETPRCRPQARLLLHLAGDPRTRRQFAQRGRSARSCWCWWRMRSGRRRVSASGPAAGLGPYLVGSLVWGIGLEPGRHDGIRHQSGARFGSADCARATADSRRRGDRTGVMRRFRFSGRSRVRSSRELS